MTTLATDHGPVPMNIGAVLVVEGAAALGFPAIRDLLADRVPRVRRMRQLLVPAPFGAGRPVWVDEAGFDLDRHLAEVSLQRHSAPVDDPLLDEGERLLRTAADLVCTPLPRDRPLWAARWVSGLGEGRGALILSMHHVLADGLGGVAVLTALGDEGVASGSGDFPTPRPTPLALAVDAWRERAARVQDVRGAVRATVSGLRELGLTASRPRLAPPTSFNRPTGAARRLTTVTASLPGVVDLAHTQGCTVNDVVLTAIVGAMSGTLRRLGEHPDELVVSVPISARQATTADQLGNASGVVPLALPITEDIWERLAHVAAISRSRRGAARGSSQGPMGLVFRALGRIGLVQPFIDSQRLVNTFVTNVRGPAASLAVAGHPIGAIIPIAVNPGNVGVSFDVLSYAGHLVVTVVADPDVVPDQDLLTSLLSDELAALLHLGP